MGWLQFQRGDIDGALQYLQRALRYSSEDPVLYDHLGDAFARAGEPDKALEYWQQALRLDPSLTAIQAKIEKMEK
jgi:pentatricopeptide repeat protein